MNRALVSYIFRVTTSKKANKLLILFIFGRFSSPNFVWIAQTSLQSKDERWANSLGNNQYRHSSKLTTKGKINKKQKQISPKFISAFTKWCICSCISRNSCEYNETIFCQQELNFFFHCFFLCRGDSFSEIDSHLENNPSFQI